MNKETDSIAEQLSFNENKLLQEMKTLHNTRINTKPYIVASDNSPYEFENHGTTFVTHTTFLRPRMRFTGYQTSGYRRYHVDVTINTVNLPVKISSSTTSVRSSTHLPRRSSALVPHMTGCITIPGLANNHKKITTFFEAYAVTDCDYGFFSSSWVPQSNDIESNNYNACLTASDQIDLEHWLNFPAFKKLFLSSSGAGDDKEVEAGFNRNYIVDYINQRYLFMRWKEKFLVPNPFLDSTEGASYDGFYYIVHDQYTGSIQGFYYHKDAEKFQRLELLPVSQYGGGISGCSCISNRNEEVDTDEVFLLNTDCSFEFV